MTPSSTEHLIQSLSAQVQQLEQMIRDQGTLGLTYGRRFIYIQQTKGGKGHGPSLWSFIAEDEPVKATALTGYVIDLYRKEDDIPKLHVVVQTRDEEYVLCSGFETHFSRDVMAAIAQLTPEQACRPLKIVPCLKDVQRQGAGDRSFKKPIYANVLLDDKTIYTHTLKKQFSADALFLKAQRVLSGQTGPMVEPKASPTPDEVVVSRSPHPSVTVEAQSVDWKAFCRQHGILPGVLKALAQELGLPMEKLNPRQSALLYHQAYARFVGVV